MHRTSLILFAPRNNSTDFAYLPVILFDVVPASVQVVVFFFDRPRLMACSINFVGVASSTTSVGTSLGVDFVDSMLSPVTYTQTVEDQHSRRRSVNN